MWQPCSDYISIYLIYNGPWTNWTEQYQSLTPLENTYTLKKWWLEGCFPLKMVPFQVTCEFSGGYIMVYLLYSISFTSPLPPMMDKMRFGVRRPQSFPSASAPVVWETGCVETGGDRASLCIFCGCHFQFFRHILDKNIISFFWLIRTHKKTEWITYENRFLRYSQRIPHVKRDRHHSANVC